MHDPWKDTMLLAFRRDTELGLVCFGNGICALYSDRSYVGAHVELLRVNIWAEMLAFW